MPSNDLTPRKFADIVGAMLKGDNILIENLNKIGPWKSAIMGGIVAVGKGSMNRPSSCPLPTRETLTAGKSWASSARASLMTAAACPSRAMPIWNS